VVGHTAEEAILGCIDGRLVLPHALRAINLRRRWSLRLRTEFVIRMAGGAAALLTDRDGDSAMGQLLDAWLVHPFSEIELQLHLGCGKLAVLAGVTDATGAFVDLDPDSVADLFRIGDLARKRVEAAFAEHGYDVNVSVTVLDIVRGWHGLARAKYLSPEGS
jgi:hypothetical protein